MKRHFTRGGFPDEGEAIRFIEKWACPLQQDSDLEILFDQIGNARIVMLGEASHGTHDYYTWRTRITKWLVENKGFNFIGVEGDWPDCYRLNRYVKGYDIGKRKAVDVLVEFDRWPTWMWANWETAALMGWMHEHNKGLSVEKRAGFYGLDVYSLWESMESILQYLKKTDPSAVKIAEAAYQCFEPYREDEGRTYSHAAQFLPALCKDEVLNLLREIRRKLPTYNTDHENVFNTEQNAWVAVNAENYYRTMLQGGPHSWNIRDRHMSATLERLLRFHGPDSKAIVWAHNTHVGDARATDMMQDGMFNIGELARLDHASKEVFLVGFGSYKGSVVAGRGWGADMQAMTLPEALKGSWEYLLHKAGPFPDKLLLMNDFQKSELFMTNPIGHRAVGVVYNPDHERFGNYVPTILPLRYDAFIFLDETTALHPLHMEPDGRQVPETYPFGV